MQVHDPGALINIVSCFTSTLISGYLLLVLFVLSYTDICCITKFKLLYYSSYKLPVCPEDEELHTESGSSYL